MNNDSYNFELKDNSFLRISHTPIKPECLTPVHLKFYQKVDYNMKFNDELNESWPYPKHHLNKPLKDIDQSPINENFKQGFEYPLSSMWHGHGGNENYDIFNGNSQMSDHFIEKKGKNNENFDYGLAFGGGKSPNMVFKEEMNVVQTNNQQFPEKIPFHLFKKPIPMYQKKNKTQNNSLITPVKNSVP
jgi:hypothetical protein